MDLGGEKIDARNSCGILEILGGDEGGTNGKGSLERTGRG